MATQDGWISVESSDKMWFTGEGNGKPLQYSWLENPINSMKRQKYRTVKDELPRSIGAQYATGEQWRSTSRKNEVMNPKQRQHSAVDATGDGNKILCYKEQYSISSDQSLSCVWLFVTPRTAAWQASLSITNYRSLFKLMSIESVMPFKYLIFCYPLFPPSIFPSSRVFLNESVIRIRWPQYWSFSFSISPSNEYSGLISFSMDWLDLLAIQGTFKSLLQDYSSKASILRYSAFFLAPHTHPYMTTGKTIVLTRQTFVGEVMTLLFNMLSRLVITFLSRSKCILISKLQSKTAVI